MKFIYTYHWSLKNKLARANIKDYDIEYAIMHSTIIRDKYWDDALNAVCRVPPSGRRLKVVYRRYPQNYMKIITAFWID